MKKTLKLLIIFILSLFMFGCNKEKQFGEFSYNGKALIEYAVKDITANEAKQLAPNNNISSLCYDEAHMEVKLSINTDVESILPSTSLIDNVLVEYSGCNVTTKYYVDGSDDEQTKVDMITGLDFKSMLTQNIFTPFNQLVAKNVLIFDDLIDYMETQNNNFKTSELSKTAPFKNVFSYHLDKNNNLVIQTRDFAEIASSVGGGIASTYRQDTEIVYDSNGKMTLWQTSLGLYTSTPQGTMKQGYILEVNFDWIVKE